MDDPRTGETVAYVGDATIDGERVVAMRSPTNRRHLRFRYFEHRVFPDEGGDERREQEERKDASDGEEE
tara:strand:- start:457 stop:663 length:207 start_codon:yes stop_codon:yes gene_type:complete